MSIDMQKKKKRKVHAYVAMLSQSTRRDHCAMHSLRFIVSLSHLFAVPLQIQVEFLSWEHYAIKR